MRLTESPFGAYSFSSHSIAKSLSALIRTFSTFGPKKNSAAAKWHNSQRLMPD